MKKIKCLITAGATREHFDPVRFISNPSSGKMGWNIANAAVQAGWDTILILGASSLPDIDGAKTVRVTSAQDMLEACQKYFSECDILIMSAAVSDVRPKKRAENKVKKDGIDLNPELERTPDILATLSKEKNVANTKQILIGFAAETDDVVNYAIGKLKQKNLDAIVANDVSQQGTGFESDLNKIDIIFADGNMVSPKLDTKANLAKTIIEQALKFIK